MKTYAKKRTLYLIVLPVLTIPALSGCKSNAKSAKAEAPVQNAGTAVVTQNARLGDVFQTVSVTGSLVALQDVTLSAKQPGRLVEVNVREGDRVSVGQILARVDATDLETQVHADEAGIASAIAKLQQARAAYNQQVTNTESGIASARAAYDQQVATSSAQVRSAQSALVSARANLSTVQEGARPEERLQTQATLASAQASFKKAQSDANRYEKLHKAGAVSDAEMDQYRNAQEVAQASLNSAQAGLKLQQEGNRRQDVEQAQEKVRQAEETLRQAQATRATDEVKKADLQTAMAARGQNRMKLADVQAAQAAVQQAQNTLAIARQAVADTVVRAPIAGRISARSAEPGQVVTSATVLLRVITLDSVYFEPSVPDTLMGAIKVGQPVDIRLDTQKGRAFQGRITRMYPQGSSSSRSVPVRVTVPNAEGLLRPNMFAQGKITTEAHRNVVLVPLTAIVTTSGESASNHVFTVEDGQARNHVVTPGLSTDKGDWIEVKGISATEAVIVMGQSSLKDGQKVTATSSVQTKSSQTVSR